MPDALTDHLTLTEAARILSCSESRVRTLCDGGALKHVRTPLGRLIDRKDAERLAASRKAAAR